MSSDRPTRSLPAGRLNHGGDPLVFSPYGSQPVLGGELIRRPRKPLRRPTIAVAALALAIFLFGCTRTDNEVVGPAGKVTIAYATPPHAVLAQIAQMQGYYLQEGLAAVPLVYSYGKVALDAVLEGKADFATVAETPFMFAVMKGNKISIIATIQMSSRNTAMLARKDRGILTSGDLKGRKIATTLGTVGEFFKDAFLAAHGISEKDINAVYLAPEEMQAALLNGDVDAVSTWDPFLTQIQRKLGGKVITMYDEDIYTETFNVVATQDFIRKNPGTIKKMLRALVRAEEFVKQHPAEAQKIVAGFSRIDAGILRDIWGGNTFSVTLDQSLLLALEDESNWAIKRGLVREKKIPDYLDFIYTDGLASVKPKAVRILR